MLSLLNFSLVLQEDEEEEEDIDSLVSFHKSTMASSTYSLRSSKVRMTDIITACKVAA